MEFFINYTLCFCFPLRFTMYIPTHTRISEISPLIPNAPDSLRTIPEIITPHIGFINPNTAIFETGLYFRSTDQSEYAAADTKARYSKTATDEI